jgi:hypothetical protein
MTPSRAERGRAGSAWRDARNLGPIPSPVSLDRLLPMHPLGDQVPADHSAACPRSLEAPLAVFSVIAQVALAVLHRLQLAALKLPIEGVARWLDRGLRRMQPGGSFALAYLLVARKPGD